MELNRERIIRGLECCTDEDKKCTDCPRFGFLPCTKPLMTDALSLIKELTEENERLRADKKGLINENEELKKPNSRTIL